MNYDKPRQRDDDKRWDYTSMNDGRVMPIGYCHAWRDWTEADKKMGLHLLSSVRDHAVYKEKYHTDGHATYEEACACYKDYQLDKNTRYDAQTEPWEPCAVCGVRTTHAVTVEGWEKVHLCDQHRSRKFFEPLFNVGESYHS